MMRAVDLVIQKMIVPDPKVTPRPRSPSMTLATKMSRFWPLAGGRCGSIAEQPEFLSALAIAKRWERVLKHFTF